MNLEETKAKAEAQLSVIAKLELFTPEEMAFLGEFYGKGAKVPCPTGCGAEVTEGRKPTLHYKSAHSELAVPEAA